jgi:hypothetical protein
VISKKQFNMASFTMEKLFFVLDKIDLLHCMHPFYPGKTTFFHRLLLPSSIKIIVALLPVVAFIQKIY